MLLEAVRLTLALAFLVALPGWLLTLALFPRREDLGRAERAYFVPAGGVLVLMLVCIILGFLPHGNKGALQSLALGGMPNVELAMIGACAGLAWVAMARGALPWLEARVPTSWRPRATAAPTSREP
ncbi:MAG TPA: hypothetical protein VM370_06320 [Candidatus Thermoplasmatota archaeon]|nr:hypothetical protein [Candidatus Thermoplasmatota archaeon]